jgi:putative ABC transport system permease protein
MVCVIGPDVADALFAARSDAIGKEITINGRKFTVIGVQEYIDDLFEISENDYIYIPITTFERLYPDTKRIYLLCSAVSQDQFDAAYDQVVNALRRVRGLKSGEPNNFGIQTQERFRTMIREITVKVQLAATAVCSVGMLVGVIGVMNIMLIAVTQRTREIGLRKAIGARRKNIIFQFLVEAATLTGFGGLIGIFFGALLGFIITSALEWHYQLSLLWTLLAIISSAGTGLIAGLYPAWKAARLDPIEALRYE